MAGKRISKYEEVNNNLRKTFHQDISKKWMQLLLSWTPFFPLDIYYWVHKDRAHMQVKLNITI